MGKEQELRPCPLCRCNVEAVQTENDYEDQREWIIECLCGIEMHDSQISRLITRWNRRSSSDEQAEVVAWTDETEIKALAEHGHGLMNARRDEGAGFVVPLYHASPSWVKAGVTEAAVLAGCKVMYPALFSNGLEPRPGDGPATRARMAETVKQVREILTAALGVGDEGMGEGWQPIETAPKDGTYVLVRQIGVLEPSVTVCSFDRAWGDDGWWLCCDGKDAELPLRGPEPVQWHPVPTPPIQGDTP